MLPSTVSRANDSSVLNQFKRKVVHLEPGMAYRTTSASRCSFSALPDFREYRFNLDALKCCIGGDLRISANVKLYCQLTDLSCYPLPMQ
jgi:hypothetical protein